MPKSGFKWKRVMPAEEEIMKMKWNSRKAGYWRWTKSIPKSCMTHIMTIHWRQKRRRYQVIRYQNIKSE